jgi:hypothetical protein
MNMRAPSVRQQGQDRNLVLPTATALVSILAFGLVRRQRSSQAMAATKVRAHSRSCPCRANGRSGALGGVDGAHAQQEHVGAPQHAAGGMRIEQAGKCLRGGRCLLYT